MTLFETTLFYLASGATFFFMIMAVMAFMGMDGTDIDADVDFEMDDVDGGTPFQIFTFRNLLAVLIGVGWGGLAITDAGYSQTSALIFGSLIGLAFATLQSTVFYLMYRLQEKNIPDLKSAEGKSAIVYQTIPKNGRGKIQVNVNGSIKTLNAVSTSDKNLPSGCQVTVTTVQSDDTCVVA